MSEAEKPKRRFWQIHLSTALLLMIILSTMIWANMRSRVESTKNFTDMPYIIMRYGFPFTNYEREADSLAERYESATAYLLTNWSPTDPNDNVVPWRRETFRFAIAANFCFLLIVLGISWYCLEFLIRRREGRKT